MKSKGGSINHRENAFQTTTVFSGLYMNHLKYREYPNNIRNWSASFCKCFDKYLKCTCQKIIKKKSTKRISNTTKINENNQVDIPPFSFDSGTGTPYPIGRKYVS